MFRRIVIVLVIVPLAAIVARVQGAPEGTWRFAVSGDSRNCGDVVMPAIAAGASKHGASFYWHLGDFRAMHRIDEDFADQMPQRSNPLSRSDYQKVAWNDFIDNQILPFGEMPVFLGIGNHETIDRTRADYLRTFQKWLDQQPISQQRLADDPSDPGTRTYYHWIERGIDFINMDNASDEQFDAAQMAWFEKVLARDEANPGIWAIIVGMHEALPDSISYGHSMSESPGIVSIQSGRQAYRDLLKAQNDFHKKVYVLASHSHFYMDGIFNTEFWIENGGVLPGWIVGTAGAERYQLPWDWRRARLAMQGVYGYLLATVTPQTLPGDSVGNTIRFEFQLVNKSDLPKSLQTKFTPKLVDYCFDQNMRKPEF